MEFGARALGNRSILANPCNKNMKNIINKKLKEEKLLDHLLQLYYLRKKNGLITRLITHTCHL